MGMKRTILTQNDKGLLEETIVRYGRIVSFSQIHRIFKAKYSKDGAKNRIALLSQLGWLVRIKKGLYQVVTDIGSLATGTVSNYEISQSLNKESYVSFENALQYHGMFDQMLSGVAAVTRQRARAYHIGGADIEFYKIKEELYFGFFKTRSSVGFVSMARKEKALLDFLHFRSNAYGAGLVWEKLRDYKDSIDLLLFKKYAKKFNLTVIRQAGFFLDRLGVETKDLLKCVRGNTGYGKMTKDSKDFDAKWRLYFDNEIIE